MCERRLLPPFAPRRVFLSVVRAALPLPRLERGDVLLAAAAGEPRLGLVRALSAGAAVGPVAAAAGAARRLQLPLRRPVAHWGDAPAAGAVGDLQVAYKWCRA